MNADWERLPHKDYPELLSGRITARLKAEHRKARKSGDNELVSKIDAASRAVHELRQIMLTAYATRLVADYEPAIPVKFKGVDRFSLNSIDVSKAHNWYEQVSALVSSLMAAWRQFYE